MAKLPEHLIEEHLLAEIVSGTVKETIKQLRREGALRSQSDLAYQEAARRLSAFFKDPGKDPEMKAALEILEEEEPTYIRILSEYYGEKTKVEQIEELIGCDRSTVLRQKKRLCLRLFQLLQ